MRIIVEIPCRFYQFIISRSEVHVDMLKKYSPPILIMKHRYVLG